MPTNPERDEGERGEFRDVTDLLRRWPDAPAPDLAERVLQAVRPPAWRAPLALAASLAVLLGATWLPPRNGPDQPVAMTIPEPDAAQEWMEAAPTVSATLEPISREPTATPIRRPLAQATYWLMAAQDADGGWSMGRIGAAANYNVGLSALALLALMTADEKAPAQDDATARGLGFLLAQQDGPSGLFGPAITGSLYNHTLACLALLEGRTPGDGREEGLKRGLALLVRHQRAEGGWSYLRARSSPPNSSLTSWALLALMEAESRGVADYAAEIERGFAWLQATVDQEGRAGYRRPGDHPHGSETLTAAVALCLAERSDLPRPRIDRMLAHVLRDAGGDTRTLDFYRTFFQATVMREAGLEAAPELSHLLARLEAAQDRTSEQAGSWAAEDPWSRTGGRVYSTALAMLALSQN